MRHEHYSCDFCGGETPSNEIVYLTLDAQAYLSGKSRHAVALELCIVCGAEAALDLLGRAKATNARTEEDLVNVNDVIVSEVIFKLSASM